MWSTIVLLPALAVLCHGAALPQVIGSPIPSAKPTTYTFVIPCPPNTNGCVPRTITMVGGTGTDPMTILPRDPQVLGDPTRTVILPTAPEPTSKSHSKTKHSHTTAVSSTTSSVTSTHKHHHTTPTVDARQVLGSPTRSVAPTWGFPGWPWWPQSIVTVTITETVTQIPDTLTTVPVPPFSPTDDYYTPGVTRTVPALSAPLDRREPQVLGEPTRTVLLTPTPLSTKKPHTSKKPTLTCDDVEKRQELGSPTRTVLVSPTPDPYPTVTVTVTTTVFPTEPWHPWPTKPSPPWWVTTRYPTSDPEPITRTVPPLSVPIGQRDPQGLGDPTRTVLLPTHKPHTSRRPVTTWNDVEERQVLGDPTGSVTWYTGDATGSVTWYTGGDDGLTTTVTLPGPTKRQVLGDPTQSFTWWEAEGSEPTAPVELEPPSKRAERRQARPRHL